MPQVSQKPPQPTSKISPSPVQPQTGSSFQNIVNLLGNLVGNILYQASRVTTKIAQLPSYLTAVMVRAPFQAEPRPQIQLPTAVSTPAFIPPSVPQPSTTKIPPELQKQSIDLASTAEKLRRAGLIYEPLPVKGTTPVVSVPPVSPAPSITTTTGTTPPPLGAKPVSPLSSGTTTTPPPSTPSLTPEGEQVIWSQLSPLMITPSPTTTNVPSGAQIEVFKDPVGGSTPVFGHMIQPGETLSKIARQYGVTIDEILRINQDNKKAIKSPDLIIAGETILIPAKTKTVSPSQQTRRQVLDLSRASLDEINQAISQTLEQAKTGTTLLPESVFSNLFFNIFQDQLSALQTAVQNLENVQPISYQEQYQRLLERSGISEDYQRIFDLNKIIRQTKDDVLREAIASGGIVTQSQVEEIVNFRTSMLRDELSALIDLVELKEKMIDRTMKYVEMDRRELDNHFDRILGLREKISQFSFNALKWGYDYYDDLIKKNRTRLMDYVKNGGILDLSLETLSNFANPNSMLYAGLTPEELSSLLRVAQRLKEKEELSRQEIIERMQRARAQARRAEEGLKIRRERLELQKQGKTEKSVNLENLIPD